MRRYALLSAGAVLALLAGLALWLSTYTWSYDRWLRPMPPGVMVDNAQLYPRPIARVERPSTDDELAAIVAAANARGDKVTMAGSRHSQGGHTYSEGAVVLDMRAHRRILDIDPDRLLLRAQAGATWAEVQDALQPLGLAVKVMQSSNIFTIGGTLSANAHGRDIHVTSVVEVLESFRLLLANGEIVQVSRTENSELFRLVIGGYGMYGVILDATLRITRDEPYVQRAVILDYTEFPEHFARHIQGNPHVALMLGRPSIDPDPASFLREVVIATWEHTDAQADSTLTEERNVLRDRTVFNLSKDFHAVKRVRWAFQKRIELGAGTTRVVSRNNAMRPPVAPLALLDSYDQDAAMIIQEYFVPIPAFVPFLDAMREILVSHDMNVMSSTVRYVLANDETVLAYAPTEDVFSIIQVSHVTLDEPGQARAQAATRALVDAALDLGGSYYLTYQLYPTREQLRRAYPRADEAFARKRHYDPNETFSSLFYETYR